MSDERRHFSRIPFQSSCYLIFGEHRFRGLLTDISLRGALITSNEKLPVQNREQCQFELTLSSTRIMMTCEADLVYCQNDQFGVKFGNVDLESMIHLRRLVELNTGDSGRVQDELFFLLTPEMQN